jgi:CBS domain-containing protein
MHVSEVLQAKGTEVVTVSPDTTVRDLVALLTDKNIGAVLVATSETPVAGIVSERDVVRGLAEGSDVLDKPVEAIMTADVETATPEQSVHELAQLMTRRRIRHVPVMTGGELRGIVSIGDVVKSRIDELQFERDQLESYVSGPG